MEMGETVLIVNGGSSSIKFAMFTAEQEPRRIKGGNVERSGAGEAERIARELGDGKPAAVGHRIVHGGPKYFEPTRVTEEVVTELKRLAPFAPNHLPSEISLVEAFAKKGMPQVLCFDTAFHRDLPEVAKVLPIPREYGERGVRRYGFHGLSYTYLMGELRRLGADGGRVILAHLGNGASLAAVRDGKCLDTSMGFTPTGGVIMGTRSGDLDPGVLAYLGRTEGMNVEQLEEMTSKRSGLIGISQVSSDMRELEKKAPGDPRCALAVEMFCYQVRKWIGAFAAAMGGLDTLVFAGGIGEHSAVVRERICGGLEFLGVRVDRERNGAGAGVISVEGAGTVVRVIATDEEIVIARAVVKLLGK
jgi:acetate kinase